ncbi:MAG: 2-aminoethylphosphonate aminotransferase [Gammaproteobacteria bacterium]
MPILLNPGPINLSERVRQAMLQPDLCHREPEFAQLQNIIRHRLLEIYKLPGTQWASILLTGSGTAAMEAMITSLVPEEGKVLIIENGVYGERLSQMARIHRIEHITLHHDWGEKIQADRLAETLQSHNGITHAAVVHHETTTGRLNDLDTIARVCSDYKIPLLVDGVSSFGAETLNVDDWNIIACAATANKCLHGVPGTSFVIVRRDALKNCIGSNRRTMYLDLPTYLEQQDTGGTPFTQSVQTFYALAEALLELEDEGGWQSRQQAYWRRMDIVRDGLTELAINPLIERDECSCVLNAFHLPDGMSYETLHDKLKEAGFVIYAGQGGLAKSIFRVSCMGAITEEDMRRFVAVMGGIVKK